MEKLENLNEFYQKKFNWMPESIRNEIGHFNIFDFDCHFMKSKTEYFTISIFDFF
jgi:hypothetical protein